MYTNRKPGVEIISGKLLDIIADNHIVKLEYEQYKSSGKGNGSVETKSALMEVPDVDLSQFQVGENITLVKVANDNKSYMLKDGQSLSLKTGSYVSKKDGETKDTGITVIRGRLVFAGYKDEKGNFSMAGTPKKEHYDLLINTPGQTHIINIYNGTTSYNSNAIQNAQNKYDNIDFKDNFVTGTFITGLAMVNIQSRMRKVMMSFILSILALQIQRLMTLQSHLKLSSRVKKLQLRKIQNQKMVLQTFLMS